MGPFASVTVFLKTVERFIVRKRQGLVTRMDDPIMFGFFAH